MEAKEYLESLGMTSTNTVLVSFIEGAMRNPDLCSLLDNFAKLKIKELDAKIMPNGGLGDPIQCEA